MAQTTQLNDHTQGDGLRIIDPSPQVIPGLYHSSINRKAVGIVGGGIAGLYTALLLRRQGISFHIFEGSERVGGRVHTHYFSTEKDQYFEAGAMRIPSSPAHDITFDLVDYLNKANGIARNDRYIQLIPYILNSKGNEIYVNRKRNGIASQTGLTAKVLGWSVPPEYQDHTARDLLRSAIEPLLTPLEQALKKGATDFEDAFLDLVHTHDSYSFRHYLADVAGYPSSVIDFIETLESQTNQFTLGVPELVMQNLDFNVEKWYTIAKGMSRLPQAMLALIGNENVSFGARVTSVQLHNSSHPHGQFVEVTARGYDGGDLVATFDKVLLAIPPAALKMLIHRPIWSPEKEMAIRSIHFEPLFKMGMRFKYRFWETMRNPSVGGQTTTDLPIRWVVFPSNGIGEPGNREGVLLVYAWMSDAVAWLPLSSLERRSLALSNLEELFGGRLGRHIDTQRDITVTELLIETFDAVWSASTATGDAMFLPGQWEGQFNACRAPENDGRVFFAGEHASYHHTWISGAAESALHAVRQMYGADIQPLNPRNAFSMNINGTGGQRSEPSSTIGTPFELVSDDPLSLPQDIRRDVGPMPSVIHDVGSPAGLGGRFGHRR